MSTPQQDKQQALRTIADTMRLHGITHAELKRSMEGDDATDKTDIAGRLFSTLGAIFIFAGVGVYIAMFWGDMNSAARIITTLGTGLVLYTVALVTLPATRFRRAIPALLLVGLVMQTTGWFVTIDELFDRGSDPRYAVLFVMAIMAIQQVAVFQKFRLSVLLLAAISFAYGFAITLLDLIGVSEELSAIAVGISMMTLAAQLRHGEHASMAWLGYFSGGCAFYLGLFELVRNTPVELLYFASTAGLIYASTYVRSTSLLTVSTIAMLAYIGYFTSRHFVNSVGWPVALILLGIAFIVVGGFAWKLKKRYM